MEPPYFRAPAASSDGLARRMEEIKGVAAVVGGIYLSLALFSYSKWERSLFTYSHAPVANYGGIAGAYISEIVVSFMGLAGYLVPLLLLTYGLRRVLGKEKSVFHLLGAAIFFCSVSMLAQLLSESVPLVVEPAGGLAGLVLTDLFQGLLSRPGTYILGIALVIIALILLSPVSIFSYLRGREKKAGLPHQEPADIVREPQVYRLENEEILIERKHAVKAPLNMKTVREVKNDNGYSLPSIDFLKEGESVPGPGKDELNSAASGLERKLADFGVIGKIKGAHPGPVVTMYEFEPAPGVKINRIVSLSEDLALALRAASIRVYPIPGKATIGIEVPNRQRATVALREIVAAENFQQSNSLLTLALGKDIFGNPVASDLSKMPHLLVAGATGAGKSVSINVMIVSLLYKATPEEVKMLMIDPKLLELSAYSGIPHLISPVITSPKEASEALKKMVYEMERRYKLLAGKGARSIDAYNRQAAAGEKLPYIVVFIDELADLMFTAQSDVESSITRLAQMARASGIHLILATQRPSVDVITGLIKANFPARISFQVTSRIDSRTILDSQGAEQLLGMGDMLFMVPGIKIVRIHGAYVSETEIKAITEFVRSQGTPDFTSFENIVVADLQETGTEAEGERDEIYQKVLDFAEAAGEVSISSIQRRFKIGYNRAASIMELFEGDGLVGPPKGAGKPRDFLGRR